MIASIRHKGLKRFWTEGNSSGLPQDQVKKIGYILRLLNGAEVATDMNFPGLNLHQLRGDLDNYWSVTVKTNWRIIFRFENGHAHLVDYLNYH
jgi:Plasmid maintenance system killer protein